MGRGIYLVANLKSQEMCENLIYSIRESGCNLPIRLIHFGGKEINSRYIFEQVEYIKIDKIEADAKQFIENLQTVLTDCPAGFLYRYLAWFLDWEEFIYADNDIVALCNWNMLFDEISDYDLIHADGEYTTKGIFNYDKPEAVCSIFGADALESAITAGHIVVKKNTSMIGDINKAVEWFKQFPDIPKKHDQSLLHIAALIGNWKMLNLCKTYNWLSSWAGDYKNSLDIIQKMQMHNAKISHIHYSGGTPNGDMAIQDLLSSFQNDKKRLSKLFIVSLKSVTRYDRFSAFVVRSRKYIKRRLKKYR